jgi:D-alanyl-D-alanine dipeptidase
MTSLKRKLAISAGAIAVTLLLAAVPLLASAASPTPVAPNLQVPIPGLDLAAEMQKTGGDAISTYIAGIYRFLLAIIGVVAGVAIMVGGFTYLTAGGDKSKVDEGKKRIYNALAGMVLAFSSYLLLYVINPDLVNFKSFKIISITPEVYTAEQSVSEDVDAANGNVIPDHYACHTVDDCRTLCAKSKSDWPTATSDMVTPKDVILVTPSQGLENPKGVSVTPPTAAALQQAGTIAVGKDPNYSLKLYSGYRPLDKQIQLVCDKIAAGDAASGDQQTKLLGQVGVSVAWPGGSNHGVGIAVDIQLLKSGTALTSMSYNDQTDPKWKDGSKALDDIMTQAGFRRYAKEQWHYEFGGTSGCRCTSPNCPFPPSCG